ncbi:MAG: HU family DNA-binding protein [Proteobacteria bacterium]|nr:HU family DNA-binding protein [Pseudomonadota bacterium]MBU2262129.1 HU family DNA-binding protein [Pseudomonadota bacterium]
MAKATSGVGKDDLVGHVAGSTELTKENAKKVINAVLEGILMILEQSGKLRLVNFGTFSVKQTKERQGINPKTQEPITIPAGYRMGFKVSKSWKEGMLARKREQAREKVKVHAHKEVPKAKAAAKLVVKKPPAKGKGKKK